MKKEQKTAISTEKFMKNGLEWLGAITAFDFIQVVKEPTWERIHNNNVPKSILDMSAVETITVDKQPISNHSLVYVTSSKKGKRQNFLILSTSAGRTILKKH